MPGVLSRKKKRWRRNATLTPVQQAKKKKSGHKAIMDLKKLTAKISNKMIERKTSQNPETKILRGGDHIPSATVVKNDTDYHNSTHLIN
jgi:hypothetical protein